MHACALIANMYAGVHVVITTIHGIIIIIMVQFVGLVDKQ